jgi:Domain of unknown function (DUF4349)
MTSITPARGTLLSGSVLSGVILLSGCLLLSACGGGSGSSAASAQGASLHGAVAAPGSAPGALSQRAASGSNPGSTATQTAKLAPASQSIVYTASLTMRSANAMTTAKQAIGIATSAGGYTSAENAAAGSPGKSPARVTLTLKIPVSVYTEVLAELSAPSLGKQLALTQQATDVTQQVADTNSLVTSQEAAITALEGLLSHAANVSQLLQVQQQISNDESELQSLQAQQRALDHETSYATVNMTLLSTARRAVAHKQHHATGGFVSGLQAGWRALRHATTAVLTGLGAALPFLLIALILAGIGLEGRRRIIRRRAGPTAAS